MNVVKSSKLLVFAVLTTGSGAALACGEMMVNSGKGLSYQSYLDPNPAEVLVLYTDGSDERTYADLEEAGHHLTLVADASQLAEELANGSYDIVIADYDMADTVAPLAASGQGVRFLPFVARNLRRSAAVKERFENFLYDGISGNNSRAVIKRAMSR